MVQAFLKNSAQNYVQKFVQNLCTDLLNVHTKILLRLNINFWRQGLGHTHREINMYLGYIKGVTLQVKHKGKESFIHLMEMVGWKANKDGI
jgi:hypothetical protein